MSNLEKIQKGMRVLQILSKIILIFAVVGVVLTSIGATLVATDVLNMENQFLHFLSILGGDAIDDELARIRVVQAAQDVQKRRLARSTLRLSLCCLEVLSQHLPIAILRRS